MASKYRRSELLSDESIATAGVKTLDVNVTDPISSLFIQTRVTNTNSTPVGHPVSAIKKIEVVDGSDVLVSLTGMEAQAKHFFDLGVPPVNFLTSFADNQSVASFNLLFGRYPWDEEMGLDPTRFNNLQIKITHDLALGGCGTPTVGTLQIYAGLFAGAAALKGFIQSKEIYAYTLVASAYEYVELPRDLAIRRLIVQSRAADKALNTQLGEIKIAEDHDKLILLDESVSNLLKILPKASKQYVEDLIGITTSSGVDHYVTPCHLNNIVIAGLASDDYFRSEQTDGPVLALISHAAQSQFVAQCRGYAPHGCLPIEFGDDGYPPDWWDVTALKSAQLRIKAGASCLASSTCQVVTEQYRPY